MEIIQHFISKTCFWNMAYKKSFMHLLFTLDIIQLNNGIQFLGTYSLYRFILQIPIWNLFRSKYKCSKCFSRRRRIQEHNSNRYYLLSAPRSHTSLENHEHFTPLFQLEWLIIYTFFLEEHKHSLAYHCMQKIHFLLNSELFR